MDPREETIYTEEHWEMRQALRKLIGKEINPYVDEWVAAKSFPAHEVCRFNNNNHWLASENSIKLSAN